MIDAECCQLGQSCRVDRILQLDVVPVDARGEPLNETGLQLNAEGTTIFLSSHLLVEIEQMCTHVGVLRDGRLIVQEELDTLLRPTGLVAVRTPDTDVCSELLGDVVASVADDRLLVRAEDPARLNAYLVGEGVRVDEIGPYRRTLEEIVLEAEARG